VGVIVAGVWASHHVEVLLGRKDPGLIVIDEVAGMMVSVALVPRSIPVLICAFFLFRLFRHLEALSRPRVPVVAWGAGVMVDDLIAGVYALVLIMGARLLFGVPR
jgi:phosphatidylglycerophosphatase A